MGDGAVQVRVAVAKTLAVAGSVLVWFPIAVSILTGLTRSAEVGALRIDYLLPAELFPAVLIGGVMLVAASFLARSRRELVCWSFGVLAAALVLLFAETAVTGLASGEGEADGLALVAAVGLLGVYSVMVVVLGVVSVLLLRDLFDWGRRRRPGTAGTRVARAPDVHEEALPDRERWNERYGESGYAMGAEPSAFLVEHLDMIARAAPGRAALDVACGEGRNSVALARAGFDVLGVDISDAGLEKARERAGREGLAITFERRDLSAEEVPPGPFDVIIIFNYLQREIIPALYERLSAGGFLVMESILAVPGGSGRHCSDFTLSPGELVRLFEGYDGAIVVAREDGADERARILFQKAAG